ncbi:hypothetical protein, partial [Uruburuella suis]|uniref:hypothetical protein n=1 Tax=Uruburuella suis TaxID=252130 RepID=UPI00248FE61C
MPFKKSKLIPNLKNKIIRRRAADSTDSTARRGNEVRLFFWIGMKGQELRHIDFGLHRERR